MGKPFVCTGCRVRLTIRPRPIPGHEIGAQRRSFSRPASNDQQEELTDHYGEIQEQRERARRQRIYEDGLRQIGPERNQAHSGGRYSGQPLKPQHLLQELSSSQPLAQRKSSRIRKITYRRPEEVKPPSVRTARTSPAIAEFEGCVGKQEFVEAWDILRQIESQVIDGIGPEFGPSALKQLNLVMRRVVTNYSKDLKNSTGLPTPLEFVQLVKNLGLLLPPLRSELLWRLASGLAMTSIFDGDIDQATQARALQQLTRIWHDTLETKVVRGSVSREQISNNSAPWSFLPAAQSVASDWKGRPNRLEDALACILPTEDSNGPSAAVVDYRSTLFVTLDLLKRDADKSSSPTTSTTDNPYWRPMVVFFDELLERIVKPNVPPTIQARLETSEGPALDYYEAMVRRFGMANIPPIRTERDRPVKDKRRPKIDVLGRPLAERVAATSVKKDSQHTEPESSREIRGSASKLTPLDKASLIEAGFSMQEGWDMDSDVHLKVINWIKRLGRSIETNNLLLTETCWNEVRKFNDEQAGASSLPLFLYEHLMLAFLALRQPRLAVEAWNAVAQAGIQPTVKTWTVMMRGCSRANDADTLEKFWARMIDQDVQPDRHAWSVRLFCLVKAQRLAVAFAGLRQMGEEWIAAVRAYQRATLPPTKGKQRAAASLPPIDLTQWTRDMGDVPRPDLAVVNSVISALATKSDEHIPRVLAWARDFAIDFDLTTYNTLLNVAMRHGKTAEAFSILKHMEAQKIQPNNTTLTVVLTALFHSDYFADLSADEQTTKLFALITSIEQSSSTARLDAKGYALAIDRMLKEHANPVAARALLDHMFARGIEPTAHIYTILMTSYFDADPPDFAAAEALWLRIQSSNSGYGAHLDTVFYDRMVEAYARHHEHVGIAPMMEFLGRMSREGKRPGWQVLERVARALTDREEWGLLQGLVDDIRESKGLLRVGVRGLVGQNEFWRFVIGTGLLGREGVLSERELRKNVSSSSFHSLGDGI